MRCEDCPRFVHEELKCRDGKINPADLEAAREVMKYLGSRAICYLNNFREELIDQRKGNPAQHPSAKPVKFKKRRDVFDRDQ